VQREAILVRLAAPTMVAALRDYTRMRERAVEWQREAARLEDGAPGVQRAPRPGDPGQ
jgi:hypothetical protein